MFKKLIVTFSLLISAPLGMQAAAALPEFTRVNDEIKVALLELHAVDAGTAQTFYDTCIAHLDDEEIISMMPQTIRDQIPPLQDELRKRQEEERKEREAAEHLRIMMAEQQRVLDQAARALRGEPEPVFVPLPDPVEEDAAPNPPASGTGAPKPRGSSSSTQAPSHSKKSHLVSNSLIIGGLSIATIALVRELKKARKDFKTQQTQQHAAARAENKEAPKISTMAQITEIFKICGTNIKSKRTKGTRIALGLALASLASGIGIRAWAH